MFRLMAAGRISRLPAVWEALHLAPTSFGGSSAQSCPVSMTRGHGKHTLPNLDYDYDALEPHISAEIMQLHHSKHHATYVNNLNVAEEKLQEATAKGCCFLNNAYYIVFGCHRRC